MIALSGIRRGVADLERTAGFFEWLLGLEPVRDGDCFEFACANGRLAFSGDTSRPLALQFSEADAAFAGSDPDGVPVEAAPASAVASEVCPVSLDHVAVVSADLAAAVAFYSGLGLVCSWSARGEVEVDGYQAEPVEGADWVHVSGGDGYLSILQADWGDYGVHSIASGPPRLVHLGLAVRSIDDVCRRLDGADVPYAEAPPSKVGTRIYLCDPSGDPLKGLNLEITEYAPGVSRSGGLGQPATSAAPIRSSKFSR